MLVLQQALNPAADWPPSHLYRQLWPVLFHGGNLGKGGSGAASSCSVSATRPHDQLQLSYKHDRVNAISSDVYYAIALPSWVAREGKWEGRTEPTNPFTSPVGNQSFKWELIFGKPEQHLMSPTAGFHCVQIPYGFGKMASKAWEGLELLVLPF